MIFNEQIANLAPSKSILFMDKARQMQATDPTVVNLAGGEPDFDTPKPVSEEMLRWVKAGYTHYVPGPGLPELRQRIAHKLQVENGCMYTPEGILVTPGGKFAIYLTVRSLVNPGDEVLYLEPGWVSYPAIIEASGGVPVPVRLKFAEHFRISLDRLEAACTEQTKLLITNYPNNPTGRVLDQADAEVLREFLERHPDVMLLSDEIYERIVYTGYRNISMASYDDLRDRVITVNGFSKSAAMTGWRIGYLACSEEVCGVIYKLFQHTMSCVSGFIQKGAVAALECQSETEKMRRIYEMRRNLFIGGLNAIPGVTCSEPEGAFYAWVKFDLPGMDSEAVCNYLLEEAKVVGVPGDGYGTDDCCVRFSYAAATDDLARAVIQIQNAVEKKIK